jgi:3-methylcrotonyl-CoA carboxylase alpha subunit
MRFKKILILNRGEIACRLIQTCQEMGIKTVAVYSEADRESRHIHLADESFALPGSAPKDTYLNLPLLLKIAKDSKCDAVHPGYGFLSERAHAAEAFLEAKIEWIGPRPKSIRLLGDKLEAKKILDKYKVPTAPWGEVNPENPSELKALAEKIGYPILLKAASGGGGKGMRFVASEKELQEAAFSAAREAKSSFGDATLLMEKFIEYPRHIEIQILGDLKGDVMHLGERECSLQRRHQKVVEEAPAPNLSEQTRSAMANSAVALAKGVGYANAGTVEFLVDAKENFYFLEVNSRLQVEHSVTEAVWGLDIVRAQIEIAAGKSLRELFPEKLHPRGHALQTRIYAEDSANQFAPCPGVLELVEWPTAVGLRIDTGVKTGSEIGLDYDAMIAKLTVTAAYRSDAIEKMLWCLKNTILFGTTTNINYLQDILSYPKVREGKMYVKLLEKEFGDWKDEIPPSLLKEVGQLEKLSKRRSAASNMSQQYPSPWETS